MANDNNKNYFEELYGVDVSAHIEKKGGLSYLSWPWAWAEVKKRHPDATFTIYENAQGWNYHTDGRTAWVKTGVTVNGVEHVEQLPIMNNSNKSMLLNSITSFDVNRTIQRSLTKACARHGLGLKIYAGEDTRDIPDGPQEPPKAQTKKKTQTKRAEPLDEFYEPAPFIQDMEPEMPQEVTAEEATPKDNPDRVKLRDFIRSNHLDAAEIMSECGIGPQSTPSDYVMALAYAKTKVDSQARGRS